MPSKDLISSWRRILSSTASVDSDPFARAIYRFIIEIDARTLMILPEGESFSPPHDTECRDKPELGDLFLVGDYFNSAQIPAL
jgi:hypothetical protein